MAVHVDFAQVFGFHEPFGDHRGCAQDGFGVEADGDIAFVSGAVSAKPHAVAYFADLFPALDFIEHDRTSLSLRLTGI
jgi:hypothetical protein